jgi:molybdenum cofactor guanylyltransferase
MDTGKSANCVAGLIIAGGKATRMGADKPFVHFQNRTLLDAVIDRARPQVKTLMLNVRAEHAALCQSRYRDAFALLPDAFDGNAGPLGGVVAGLRQLPCLNAEWLATFPCDTPFLPRNVVAALWTASPQSAGKPVVAIASGKVQSLCALWPYECLDTVHKGVVSGAFRSVWWTLDKLGATRVDIAAEPHAFFNINTSDDLAEAERLARDGERT